MLICIMPFSLNKILTYFFPKCLNSKCWSPTKLDGDRKGRCGRGSRYSFGLLLDLYLNVFVGAFILHI